MAMATPAASSNPFSSRRGVSRSLVAVDALTPGSLRSASCASPLNDGWVPITPYSSWLVP
jgi:hypothetical protein